MKDIFISCHAIEGIYNFLRLCISTTVVYSGLKGTQVAPPLGAGGLGVCVTGGTQLQIQRSCNGAQAMETVTRLRGPVRDNMGMRQPYGMPGTQRVHWPQTQPQTPRRLPDLNTSSICQSGCLRCLEQA